MEIAERKGLGTCQKASMQLSGGVGAICRDRLTGFIRTYGFCCGRHLQSSLGRSLQIHSCEIQGDT